MFAARMWWLLRWMGHEKVAVLDGGLEHWLECEHTLSQDAVVPVGRQFISNLREGFVVNASYVRSALDDSPALLMDARANDRYLGLNESIDPIAGHIPGAVSVPFMGNLNERGSFFSSSALHERYQVLLKRYSIDNCIVYCGSGVTAAHNILAMYHAGLGEAKLYAGSWSDWITDPERPVETGS